MARLKKKTDELKLLGIWLPPEERWQIKEAAAARRMTLNQAVRQALQEWMARSQPASAPTEGAATNARVEPGSAPPRAGVPQPDAKPGREAVLEYAAKLLRQTVAANAGKPSASRPRPATTPTARPQASAPTHQADPPHKTAAPVRSKASFSWLRGAAGLDWSACPAVEGRPAPDGSRVWVFCGTGVTLKKVFRLLQEGHRSAKVGKRFNLDPQVCEEVLRFAAQRLAPSLPGAR